MTWWSSWYPSLCQLCPQAARTKSWTSHWMKLPQQETHNMTPGKKLGALSRKHLLEVKRHQLHLKPKFIHLKGCYKICKNKYLLLFGIYTKSTHRSWFTVIYSVSSSVKDKHLTVTIPEYSLYQARAALSLFLHLQRIPQNLLLDGR